MNFFLKHSMLRSCILTLAIFCVPRTNVMGETQPIEITEPLDYRSAPIDYFGPETADAIEYLKSRIEKGEVTLRNRESSGYLLDLLNVLNVPITSQTLVFSRSSLQESLINPKNPRAIYFNDEVAVGWIPGSPLIEITAQDPKKGAIFYTLPQPEGQGDHKRVSFVREERCVECHSSNATLNIPGYLLRSFQVDEFGERDPQSEFAEITHAVPYNKRWGGWYVTGRTSNLSHVGNLVGGEDNERHDQDPNFRGTVTDLSSLVDLSKYPSKHSDVVALMVLEHQTRFYDLVTRVQYEHRLGVRSDAEDQLSKYTLMEDEAPLPGPVAGTTNYAAWYQSVGCKDNQGKSLRDLNLKTRLFENRISPLVRSRAFQSLPSDVKSRLLERFQVARSDVRHLLPANLPNQTKPNQFATKPQVSPARH